MIVPMKKVSVVICEKDKERALNVLRRLGVVHIEEIEGSGERLLELKAQIERLSLAEAVLLELSKEKQPQKNGGVDLMLDISNKLFQLLDEKNNLMADIASFKAELDRLSSWGVVDPAQLKELKDMGIELVLYEMPLSEYKKLSGAKTIVLDNKKKNVKFALVLSESEQLPPEGYRLRLPSKSTAEISNDIMIAEGRIKAINSKLHSYLCYVDSLQSACLELEKEAEFEAYSTGMETENISDIPDRAFSVACIRGFIPADDVCKLKMEAKHSSFGLIIDEPTEDDNVPTKLENNKLVSLIYPLTDFLGTVPGYFEYDISAWFLGFILVFFGIIFGDGGYGLLICTVAGTMIAGDILKKREVSPAFMLIFLMGAATVLWGALTCTWFGISPEILPSWLRNISVPVISNVYSDKIWYPQWTNGTAGLTTAQNVQIFCFLLALIQLSVAHIKGMVKNRRSLKLLSDLGGVMQLVGIFYVVLSLVVNGEVFSLGLVIYGVPVGTVAIVLVLVGFAISFVFANYEGSIGKSILDSLKNIVSCLLGVVNVFSDIVSYIRLWAVGLAGAAISATVNDLAGPLLGDLTFILFAVIILVFGHGLNMILNVLSVIVHGVRLNTLEFSSHLDMSWGGHKYKPFKE